MKAEELMIGNWVYDECKPVQVSTIMKDTSYWLKPIPLTEEWLVKLGFTKGSYYATSDVVCITYSKDRVTYDISQPQGWIDNTTKVHIENVHQLQNLYLSLTGKYLTTKYERMEYLIGNAKIESIEANLKSRHC